MKKRSSVNLVISKALQDVLLNRGESIQKAKSHPRDLLKRSTLKRLVNHNTKCGHTGVYSQITFICRRLARMHEDNKITNEQALTLIMQAHEQLAHKSIPKDTVAEQLHKALDKLENNEKSLFGIIMANSNSSVHRKKEPREKEVGKYSESYWADVI